MASSQMILSLSDRFRIEIYQEKAVQLHFWGPPHFGEAAWTNSILDYCERTQCSLRDTLLLILTMTALLVWKLKHMPAVRLDPMWRYSLVAFRVEIVPSSGLVLCFDSDEQKKTQIHRILLNHKASWCTGGLRISSELWRENRVHWWWSSCRGDIKLNWWRTDKQASLSNS